MEKNITGVMVYYYEVCKRKLWYFYHNISMEQNNENVLIGKLLDENSYKREEKHINIDDTINIDFIRNKGMLHEVKKSKCIEEASILQVKYYLWYLKQRGVEVDAQIDYPLIKQSLKVQLSQEDEEKIQGLIEDIKEIVNEALPPKIIKSSICKKCAYYDLCYI